MDLRTYRASSLQEALRLVRADLVPDASVLHTRDVVSGLSRWLGGTRQIEVTASAEIEVPSRLEIQASLPPVTPTAHEQNYRTKFRADLFHVQRQSAGLEELCRKADQPRRQTMDELAGEICVTGPLRVIGGRTQLVALVGPTG